MHELNPEAGGTGRHEVDRTGEAAPGKAGRTFRRRKTRIGKERGAGRTGGRCIGRPIGSGWAYPKAGERETGILPESDLFPKSRGRGPIRAGTARFAGMGSTAIGCDRV
ncbi:hypothetical protein [Burkholderia plantarii]|uniref:hypothetical protein n=1 Tax=Burkholderia plantarii TaxID=41899 RepID=UPI0011E06217|nr:hypothetical protein [Burkholderia plantarii]GLZ17103.1 hypothetical protein Bpla01_06330 [Burkholderia plantarii]